MDTRLRVIDHAHAVDPVCGMTVLPEKSAGEVVHGGRTYYFCGRSCVERFRANPDAFLTAKPAAGPAAMPVAVPIMLHASRLSPVDVSADASAEYTCPMHPEVRQVGPGSCPICGMALEPVRVTLEAPPNHELDDMTRRFRVSLGLSLPILAVMVGDALPGRPLDKIGRAHV
mgnify:CR=1 FL=1